MKKTVIITGADGYVGWYLALHLAEKGSFENIVCVDNCSKRNLLDQSGVKSFNDDNHILNKVNDLNYKSKRYNMVFEFGDLKDSEFVQNLLIKHQPHTIVHLAQQSSAIFSSKNPETMKLTHDENVSATLNLLSLFKELSPKSAFIKVGTLGKPTSSFYSTTKAAEDLYCEFFGKEYGLNITSVDFGSIYGFKIQNIKYARFLSRFCCDNVFGTIINRILGQVVLNDKVFIYGNEEQKIPIIHIEDVIKVLNDTIKRRRKKRETFKRKNSFSELISIKDIFSVVEKVIKKKRIHVLMQRIITSKNNKVSFDQEMICEENELKKIKDVAENEISDMLKYKRG